MKVDARLDGAQQAVADLQRIRDKMADFRPFFEQIAPMWVDREKALFAGRLKGRKLKPLAQSTIERRGKHAPLVVSGRLRDATYTDTPVKATRDQVTFGIPKGHPRRWLAIIHAQGGGRLPRRDVVPGWTTGEREQIAEKMRNWVTEGLT